MLDKKRYEGRPLHRFLELYVLESIGELSQSDRQMLEKIAPKLKEIYGGGEYWFDAIAAAVKLPSDAPSAIRAMWNNNQKIARTNGVKLTPQEFAEMFVDDNFLDE
jgi:hypothetical protein